MSLSPSPNSARFATGAQVWVVDDSPTEAHRLRTSLSTQHDVRVFHEAATMLEALAVAQHPDVLLLDWNMPEMSGLEACRYVRERYDRASLPIVVLTASNESDDLIEALAAGANDFLRKPIVAVELAARVTALVGGKRVYQRMVGAEAGLREEASFREQFLAIVAHDLRQPLSIVALGSAALAETATSQASRERIANQLGRAADRMQRMIAELLDFSRSRPRGRMPISPREMELGRLVAEVVDEIRLVHGAESIELMAIGACWGMWDADRLAQVVSNLVENAIGHRAPGTSVRVTVERRSGIGRLSVENDGETIPRDVLPRIFEAFRQGPRAREQGGLGLGLFIASQIVVAHRGSIEVSSAEGTTCFEVSLPVQQAPDAGDE